VSRLEFGSGTMALPYEPRRWPSSIRATDEAGPGYRFLEARCRFSQATLNASKVPLDSLMECTRGRQSVQVSHFRGTRVAWMMFKQPLAAAVARWAAGVELTQMYVRTDLPPALVPR